MRGKKDGRPLKTILEYAEEKGLLTGVVTNSPLADATPAATYAHANDRATFGQIFRYVIEPCYGDGVDVAIGPGLERILKETQDLGIDLPQALQQKGKSSRKTIAMPSAKPRTSASASSGCSRVRTNSTSSWPPTRRST